MDEGWAELPVYFSFVNVFFFFKLYIEKKLQRLVHVPFACKEEYKVRLYRLSLNIKIYMPALFHRPSKVRLGIRGFVKVMLLPFYFCFFVLYFLFLETILVRFALSPTFKHKSF